MGLRPGPPAFVPDPALLPRGTRPNPCPPPAPRPSRPRPQPARAVAETARPFQLRAPASRRPDPLPAEDPGVALGLAFVGPIFRLREGEVACPADAGDEDPVAL